MSDRERYRFCRERDSGKRSAFSYRLKVARLKITVFFSVLTESGSATAIGRPEKSSYLPVVRWGNLGTGRQGGIEEIAG